MKYKLFTFTLLLIAITGVSAQKKQGIILQIGDKKFTKDEFIRVYDRNNINLQSDADRKSPAGYMELFINFQLKVLEAECLKMDTNKAYITELAGYRKDLAAPYLTDISFDENLVKEMYRRMSNEVKASHILFSLDPDAPPAETLAVYNKALKVRDEIMKGLDFNEAAATYSEDPSAKGNKGNLPYFSAFQMVYPFEEAAFTTPIGQVSLPFRTNFGYHLAKVEDFRKSRGEIRVAHIMKSFPQNADDVIKKNLKKEIDSIYIELVKAADFAELAAKKSDDKRTAAAGGELPWFTAARMIPEFAEPAFSLPANGEFTQPIMTPFGYHIIKRLDYRPVESFDKLKKEIENRLKTDPERSKCSKDAFIAKLKKEYNVIIFDENLKQFNTSGKGGFKDGKWASSGVSGNVVPLFRIKEIDYNSDKFAAFLAVQSFPPQVTDAEAELKRQFELWQEKELTDYEDSQLEAKYPEFRDLLREYHDGILLFNISDEKIWSYATKDSAGLKKYYEETKGKHLWDERFKGMIVRCRDMETRYDADKYFAAGMNKNEVMSLANMKEARISIEEGAWGQNQNPVVDFYVWNGPRFEGFNELLTFVRGDKVKSEPKTLEEAKGLYLADYQKYLEDKWIDSLKKKYKIKINRKLLNSVRDNRFK